MGSRDREATPMPGSVAEGLERARKELEMRRAEETIAGLTFLAFEPYEHQCSTKCPLHGDNDLRAGLKKFKANSAASSSESKSEEDKTKKKYNSSLSKARLMGYQLKASVESALLQDTDPEAQRAQVIIDSVIDHSTIWNTMGRDKSDQDGVLLEELQGIAMERQCPDLGLDFDESGGGLVDVEPTTADQYWSQVADKSSSLKSQLGELCKLYRAIPTETSAST
jgi:hypothetical protein